MARIAMGLYRPLYFSVSINAEKLARIGCDWEVQVLESLAPVIQNLFEPAILEVGQVSSSGKTALLLWATAAALDDVVENNYP